ncbi:MAG: hypothetical protein J6T29_03285 [Alphaproteobacteria bacterium]|nr:hypothetical protein [Alphaproteobacteria bacterium]MBO7641712.1 hypothetical protein [Alphaproteobacteria bacterium]
MDKKYIYLGLILFVLAVVLIEPTYCQNISNEAIAAVTQPFCAMINKWGAIVIIAGLCVSGIFLFISDYRTGFRILMGTFFLCIAKSFAVQGQATVLGVADQILRSI